MCCEERGEDVGAVFVGADDWVGVMAGQLRSYLSRLADGLSDGQLTIPRRIVATKS